MGALDLGGPSESEIKISLPSLPAFNQPIEDYLNFSPHRESLPNRTAELFELRNLFLDHCWHYGLNVTAEKRDALSRGDMSGLIVHPILVDVCQLLGYHRSNQFPSQCYRGETPAREAEQARLIFDFLQREEQLLDSTTLMQVYNLLGVYSVMRGEMPMFFDVFNKLGTLVLSRRAPGFDDVLDPALSNAEPSSCCPQGPVQESRSAFSAMIFVAFVVSLSLKTNPILDPALLAKFRNMATMHWRDTELNFIRARSVLFLYDTQILVEEGAQLEFGNPTGTEWSKRYWALSEDLHAYLGIINTPLIEVSFIHEAQVFTLKTCIIIALAALAELYSVFAPFQPELRRKREEVIDEIATITSMFVRKDFQYLDSALGVCWEIALRPILGDDAWLIWHDMSQALPVPRSSPAALVTLRDCYQKLSLSMPSCVKGIRGA
ncbi:hypothetical protein B0H14DRAFT_2803445 [Mycena olivaceomarginata]|nr:hypothetical protein B0H14DRAFT_2803445 [Mycena olivaceomarginata]